MENKVENSDIKKFFRNTNVLLTGGTGLIGKLLISKLLVTCEVSRIYLLIRKKSSKRPHERLQELFDDVVFNLLKDKKPQYENSIVLIEGDCSLENLGLTRENEETVCKNVNIVIHAAAAMNYVGSLKTAILTNVCGTMNLCQLAKKVTNLKNFTYVSSLGAHCDQQVLEEKIYDLHMNYDDLLNLLKIDAVLPIDNHDEKKIVGSKTTIYALTKGAAEQIFLKENLHAPVMIFRCNLVLPCWKEPLSGWTDNFYGTNGMIAICLANGPITFLCENTLPKYHGIPADYVINALIAGIPFSNVEYEVAKKNAKEVSPCVLNYSNANRNAPYIDSITSCMKEKGLRYPSFCKNKIVYYVFIISLYYIPAAFVDIVAPLVGLEFRARRMIKTIIEINVKFSKMANQKFHVIDNNVQKCWENLNVLDKEIYPFEPSLIKWDEYLPINIEGVQAFMLRTKKYRSLISLSLLFPFMHVFFVTCYITLGIYGILMVYGLFS